MPSADDNSLERTTAGNDAGEAPFADGKSSYIADFREDHRLRQRQADEASVDQAYDLIIVVSVVCFFFSLAGLLAGLDEETQLKLIDTVSVFVVSVGFFVLYVWGAMHRNRAVGIASFCFIMLWILDASTGGGRTILPVWFDVFVRIYLLMKLHDGAMAARRLRGEIV